MQKSTDHHAIILFDGVCSLCNSSIHFIIKHDKKNYFRYATLQSEIGKEKLKECTINETQIDSLVLIENNTAYTKSTAVLRIAKHLNKLYPLLYGFMIIPSFIRNIIYNFIARNRYTWFGKRKECMISTDEIKEKFIS